MSEIAFRSCLSAFSTTLRTKRKLRFSPSTQCSKCQQRGHHISKCPNQPSCRWCTLPHLTGSHTCPTTSCSVSGRTCEHTLVKSVNYNGPHEARHLKCPNRPTFQHDYSTESF